MAAVFAVCLFFVFNICAAVICMSLPQLPPYSKLASFDLTFDNRIVEKTMRYIALLIFCPSPSLPCCFPAAGNPHSLHLSRALSTVETRKHISGLGTVTTGYVWIKYFGRNAA